MRLRRGRLREDVTVETYQGDGATGPVLAAPVTVKAVIESRRQLVRSASGDEVVSETTLTVHADDADLFTPESVVSFRDVTTRVITAALHTDRGRPVRADVTTL